jgi:hypothetical protein
MSAASAALGYDVATNLNPNGVRPNPFGVERDHGISPTQGVALGCHALPLRGEMRIVLAQVTLEAPTGTTDDAGSAAPKKPKLDRRTKIELMFVLVSLVAVGLGLIAFTWLTARLTRRYMKQNERKTPTRKLDPVFTDDWAAKPLTPEERSKLDSPEW